MKPRVSPGADGGGLVYRIENVGGCRRSEIILHPGVVVLKGRNGVGKTSAIRAIARAGGADVPLEVRDGAPGGSVEGPGVALKIRKQVSATGVATTDAADVGPLADLIEPGLKDPVAAARARLRALLRMVPLRATAETMLELCGGDEAVADLAAVTAPGGASVLDASEAARGAAHKLARECEGFGATARAEASALLAAIEAKGVDGDETKIAPEGLRAAVQDAARGLDVAREGLRRRREAEVRLSEAQAAGGSRPDIEGPAEQVRQLDGEVSLADADVSRLQEELAAAKERASSARTARSAAKEAARVADGALRRWEAQQAILTAPVEGPTEEDVAAATAAYNEAAEDLSLATACAEVRELRRRRDGLLESQDLAAGRAADLRELALTTSDRLAQLLGRSGLEGMAIVDGRLCVEVGGELRDFADRLSDGEKVTAALRVAAVAYPGRVVPLDGRFWQALDPQRKVEFAAAAERAGLFCVTEEAADVDGIQGEHVGFAVEGAS